MREFISQKRLCRTPKVLIFQPPPTHTRRGIPPKLTAETQEREGQSEEASYAFWAQPREGVSPLKTT